MTSHFPPLYKDELFYSALARYHQRSGNKSSKETISDLFGKSSNTAISNFTGNLSVLCKRIGPNNYNPVNIIRNHTLLPYFQPFISQELDERLISQMTLGMNSVSVTLGLAASTVKETKNFRFCNKCFVEETAMYGEAYWHRSHQLPGIIICHKHKEGLMESRIPYRNKTNRHNFIPLNEQAVIYGEEIMFPEYLLNPLDFLSEQSYRLLNDENLLTGVEKIRDFYLGKLYQRGYITTLRRLRVKELLPDFLNAFEKGLLNFFESGIGENQMDNWFLKVLRKPRVSCHPLRHLLVLMFLEEVMPNNDNEVEGIQQPFGSPPWPCLNKISNHYKNLTINHCEVTTDSKSRKPVGTFTCHFCNFTYSRKGPDLLKQDRYKIGKVKNYGEVWMKKLYELNSTGKYSTRSIASYMNVDSKTVNRYLKADSKIKITGEFNENVRKEKMNSFLRLRVEKPSLSRTGLRIENPALYMWLYRNDKEWLLNNLPFSQKRMKAKGRINWTLRDEEYSLLIIIEAVNILIRIPLTRVTKTTIAKRLDLLAKFQNCINMLPNCNKILDDITETNQEFQIRRIRYYAEQFRRENIPYSKSRLVRTAGLKNIHIQNKVYSVLNDELNFHNL